MWPNGQVGKPGPAYPATAAAWPPRGGFVFGSSVAGVADPGAARSFEAKLDATVAACASPNVSPNDFLAEAR